MLTLVVFIIILLCSGLLLLWLAQRARTSAGLPIGKVVYSDTSAWKESEKPLISQRYGLVGRPDYLVEVVDGSLGNRQRITIPIEVKSRKRPPVLYESHLLQLATYCLLIEDNLKKPPPYGLLHYADETLQIPYTTQLRNQVLRTAAAVRKNRRANNVHRQHNDVSRCQGCGYRDGCKEEALG
ncbi:Dna2/Cas4 domain-containing protein [Chloroflexi bacterium TSY]|nr:Dna2/Cas4 domain-containing protein [Chloroflexi bacterium TSY]